jgi:transposase-like protein
MAATTAPKARAPRRSWPPAEKRRIVELTLRAGASVLAIAREHGVRPNSLHRWRTLYRTGKLDAQVLSVLSAPHVAGPAGSATFVPVGLVSEVRRSQPAARPDAAAGRSGIVQLLFASGATLRIEIDPLDPDLLCAVAYRPRSACTPRLPPPVRERKLSVYSWALTT